MVGDGARTNEGDMANGWVGGEVIGGLGPADEGLNKVGGVSAALERGAGDGGEEGGGPGRAFGGFDNDGAAGEQGGNYGTYEVVELGTSVEVWDLGRVKGRTWVIQDS